MKFQFIHDGHLPFPRDTLLIVHSNGIQKDVVVGEAGREERGEREREKVDTRG